MMRKKYELTGKFKILRGGAKLYQIKALVSLSVISRGDLGGWIESEKNLSHSGDAWVYGNARVSGDARVYGDAWVSGDALVSGDDYLQISPIGSEGGTLTATISKDDEIIYSRGCFLGDEKEFLRSIDETHGDNHHAQIYRGLINVIKLKLGRSEQ